MKRGARPRATRWLEGRGLHGGEPSRARVVLEHDRGGYAMRRVELPGSPVVVATLDAVEARAGTYATSLLDPEGRPFARTVEHVLSALVGAGVARGAVVELEGAEVPCLDGAGASWFDALRDAGLARHAPPLVDIDAPFVHEIGSSRLELLPAEQPEVVVEIDFAEPIGRQLARWDGRSVSYREEIAEARTFAWADEVIAMLERGLARGVDPGAALVFGAGGAMTPLRWADEPARHKLLDLVGDLALLGGLPRARVRATRPGHAFVASALLAWASGRGAKSPA